MWDGGRGRGRWSGVKSTDSKLPCLVLRCTGLGKTLGLLPGPSFPPFFIDPKRSMPPNGSRPLDRKGRYRCDRTIAARSLTLTIGAALDGLIVAPGHVADVRTGFAVFVVMAAVFDGGATYVAALDSFRTQGGARGSDGEQRQAEQSDRCIHLETWPRRLV